MPGKKKCKILKEIRRKIADENDIPYVTEECRYQGACKGTCPKCESELRYLEEQLEKRRAIGKAVTVSALALGLVASGMSGCTRSGDVLEGDVPYVETDTNEPISLEGDVAYTDPGTDPDETLEGEVALTEETETASIEGSIASAPESETASAGDAQN